MITKTPPSPKRGEIWVVNLDPTIGAEMKKTRPVVVMSSNSIGILPIKLVAPITKWKDWFSSTSWIVPLQPDVVNGLTENSAVDALQLRGVSINRFLEKKGRVSASLIEEIATAIAIIVEYT